MDIKQEILAEFRKKFVKHKLFAKGAFGFEIEEIEAFLSDVIDRVRKEGDKEIVTLVSNGIVHISEDDNLGKDEAYCEWFRCRNCKETNITRDSNYCPNCGRQINWVNPKEVTET